jgi:subtilisin family serine protease
VPRPVNDNFVNATLIAGPTGLAEGSNVLATREPDEPAHGGSGGSASIWYRWTAPADGDLVVATGVAGNSASTSSFDTLLGVYTGGNVGDLSVRAANDDVALSSGQLWSRVVLEVTAGTTYNVAVDGWGGARGLVRLSWAFTAIDNTIKPSEPRSVTVSALDGSGYVNWLAPATTGRGTISYTATAMPGGASCTTVGLRCLIGGLANGTQYSVTVTARNTAGEGPASNPPVSFTPNTAANRPIETRAWGLDRIDQRSLPLNGVISRTSSGRAVTAYVIDTGVLAGHVEFGARVGQGRNTIEGATNPTDATDCNGHGTHVAGTIAGATFGVAPDASIIPIKVLDCYGSGSLAGVVAGIDWMVGHHEAGVPAVANMSLGGSASIALNQAVARAVADGITVVVAAGNSNADACGASPASEPLAITVGATDRTDARASYSNFGSCVDIFAPGSGVLSAGISRNDAEATLSGTSMASPHVAGAVALILETTPSLAPNDVARVLAASATRGVVSDPGPGSPDGLLYIGRVEPAAPAVPSTTSTIAPEPPATGTPSTDIPTTTIPTNTVAPAPAAPPFVDAPVTTSPGNAEPQPVTTVPVASQSEFAADVSSASMVTAPPISNPLAVSSGAPAIGVRSVSREVDAGAQPTASVVQSTPDRVLVRISNAAGSVDVLVNGKMVLRTKKRVVVLKSKGISAKRITVRASRAK